MVEHTECIDNLEIDVDVSGKQGFQYFHNKFGMPYPFFLKRSLESGHKLFVAIRYPNKLVAFSRFETVEDPLEEWHNYEKKVIVPATCLLRSIEVHASHRHIGIGRVLFSIASNNLRSNIITFPDNVDAARFFEDKLMFSKIEQTTGSIVLKYPGYLLLPSPAAISLIHTLIEQYPRVLLPDLIDLYESIMFRKNMGKPIDSETIVEFEENIEAAADMLHDKMLNDMLRTAADIREINCRR